VVVLVEVDASDTVNSTHVVDGLQLQRAGSVAVAEDDIKRSHRVPFLRICQISLGAAVPTPQFAALRVEPRIPEIKRFVLAHKRALEIRLGFAG